MHALVVSFAVIFVAELGDKSQLMALVFATRYRATEVLLGVTAATAAVHALSVGVGAALGASLPTDLISVVAGLAFFGFAGWTIRGDSLDANEGKLADQAATAGRSAVAAASVAFFLAELGDKTMLATVTLATTEGAIGTWAGSTLGMVAADALAIAVGNRLGRHLSGRVVAYGAATSFVVFGVVLIANGVR